MTSAADLFVIALARASGRTRYFLRGLNKADRDDIMADAMLWCWEHRAEYQPTLSLEDWFTNAVRDARKRWRRHEGRQVVDLEAIPAEDPAVYVERVQRAEQLIKGLTRSELRVLELHAQGYTKREIQKKLSVGNDYINEVRKRVGAEFEETLPNAGERVRVVRLERCRDLSIDEELARLDFPPPKGKDCPPCWRCKWFEGYQPNETTRNVRMNIEDAEVDDAVRSTELEKIRIAKEVSDGY